MIDRQRPTLSCLDHVGKTDQNCIQFLSLYVSDFFSGSYPISIRKKRVEIFAESQFDQNLESIFFIFFDLFLIKTTDNKSNPPEQGLRPVSM